jgi:hypothetical protein
MNTSSSLMAEPVVKHKNYDRELTDREWQLVAGWRDPKQRRNELSVLIWAREIIAYAGVVFGVVLVSAQILISITARHNLSGQSPWALLGELQRILMLTFLVGLLARQLWTGLGRQIAALKYIGQLEDRMESEAIPSHV